MALSPMMKQYLETKEKNPDCLLMFRLGDFYEMFFEDAVTASKELELVLTGKNCGLEERAPMCGVPYHAVDGYVAKLVEKGYKVAICEQLSIPKKGLAEREVVRVVTPGTVMENELLEADKNNYLMSLCKEGDKVGVCWADISTGEFNRATIDAQIALRLNDLISRVMPAEIICDPVMKAESRDLSVVKYGTVRPFEVMDKREYDLTTARDIIPKMCKDAANILKEDDVCVRACGALLRYVRQTQKRDLRYIRTPESEGDVMALDSNAIKTLELLESSDGKKQGSLYKTINMTSTGMGARLLTKWLAAPSKDARVINARLDGVGELTGNGILRGELSKHLSRIFDIERLSAKLSYGSITPKMCLTLLASLEELPEIKSLLADCGSEILHKLYMSMDDLKDVADELRGALSEDAPANVKDGGIFRNGYNADLDSYRSISKDSKSLLAAIEAEQKQRTGIKNLRVGFNSVFGYYIEVPKSQSALVPYEYVRKQTVANAERYITEELKEVEDKVLHAEERALALETELYAALIKRLSAMTDRLLSVSAAVAHLDVLVCASLVAAKYKYHRPVIGEDIHEIKIKEGRHAVVERTCDGNFVPNDTYLNDSDSRIMIITGPNMAGKSVYMRQVALIVILAHMGFYVPAESAEITLTDRIFTRVGASDDLHTGRSTFMVEMSEVSSILENATDHSLILLDEVGRGTATYDGLSIAWAIVEYLSSHFKAKVMFSTHYHELTDLEGVIDGVKNCKMTVKELAGSIVFMHKVMRGSANRSFGIEVAGLSGLPSEVLVRAKELLKQLEKLNIARRESAPYTQVSMFSADKSAEIIKILRETDLDGISPRAAYEILSDLKEKAEADN